MKKAVVIFLCLQLISGNMFAVELLKLPFLIEHYTEHVTAEHRGEAFADFMVEHYVDSVDTHDHDGHCHEHLPFKHCHDCCSSHAITILFILPETAPCVIDESSYQTAQVIQPVSHHSVYHGFIWQPPKVS